MNISMYCLLLDCLWSLGVSQSLIVESHDQHHFSSMLYVKDPRGTNRVENYMFGYNKLDFKPPPSYLEQLNNYR